MGGLVGASTPTFTRATTATYADPGLLVATAASGVRRNNHMAYAGTMARYYRSTLLEGARTNLVIRSGDLTHAAWTAGPSYAVAGSQTDPFGGSTAVQITRSAAGTGNGVISTVFTYGSSATKAALWFVKAGTAPTTGVNIFDNTAGATRVFVTLSWSGGVPTPSITAGAGTVHATVPLTNGWYAIFFSANSCLVGNNHFTGCYINAPDATPITTLAAAAQSEDATFPSSYIPTTTAAVTRNSDDLSFPFPYAPQAMTVYCRHVEGGTLLNGTNSRAWAIGNPGSNNSFYLIPSGAGGAYRIAHKTAAGGTVTSTAAAGASLGDLVETRAILYADGSVALGQSVNSAAEVVAATSAANTLAAAWNALFFYVNGESGAPGYNAYANLAVLPGTASLAQCRAAANV